MNPSLSQGSAKIYQFPVGGRAALGNRSVGEVRPVDQNTPRLGDGLCSGSWYHQAAIDEAKPKWER